MKKIRFREVVKNVFLVNFSTQYELASTFLRFQEYYESPKFKGKIFTVKQFKKWYVKNSPQAKKKRRFTYYGEWNGFNIPSHILGPFYKGLFDPLDKKEKLLLGLFRRMRRKRFYIIGACKGDKNILKHEIAHGLFYTNLAYRKKVLGIVKQLDRKSRRGIEKYLLNSGGYDKLVVADETNSYLITELDELKKNGVDIKKLEHISSKLKNILETTIKRG